MAPSPAPRELTWRGIVIGALITVVFTASNIYLGLRIGLTIATSIPAAVISMAVLRALGGGTIAENNLVPTHATAAGPQACVFARLHAVLMGG
ncbi:OPT/YSL family transporter, partial [Komagataeibacter rhaeticus]|uniref:OPT/YSL family transporter n=1 Tax=Komagataeibacter rhaeticus TaxID=215221 RepID=UPI0039E9344E